MSRVVVAVVLHSNANHDWQPCEVYAGSPIEGVARSLAPGKVWSDGWGNHYMGMAKDDG